MPILMQLSLVKPVTSTVPNKSAPLSWILALMCVTELEAGPLRVTDPEASFTVDH